MSNEAIQTLRDRVTEFEQILIGFNERIDAIQSIPGPQGERGHKVNREKGAIKVNQALETPSAQEVSQASLRGLG